MYLTQDGQSIFVVDAHVHLWDARTENRLNRYGDGFIETFFNAHKGLTPANEQWDESLFNYYGADHAAKDLFEDGYCDMAILQPVYLRDFYKDGFNTTKQNAALKNRNPKQIILNGRCDPRDGDRGLAQLEADFEVYQFTGVKLYTAEWNGASRGFTMKDPIVVPYLEKCRDLGIKNIHLHKGPTTYPLDYDAFDVRDVDYVATMYPDLNFIVDHCSLPRIDDFCFIASQEPNVYGGLALIPSYIHARPKYFAQMMSDLLFFVGPDRLLFGSDYAITSPKWLIEQIMAFEFDDETAQEAGTHFTAEVKRKILGLNAAKLYNIDVPAECKLPMEV